MYVSLWFKMLVSRCSLKRRRGRPANTLRYKHSLFLFLLPLGTTSTVYNVYIYALFHIFVCAYLFILYSCALTLVEINPLFPMYTTLIAK